MLDCETLTCAVMIQMKESVHHAQKEGEAKAQQAEASNEVRNLIAVALVPFHASSGPCVMPALILSCERRGHGSVLQSLWNTHDHAGPQLYAYLLLHPIETITKDHQ